MEAEEVAVGVFRIINSQMADLIRKSTIEQGHDPRECVLVAYGGAGPTHAVFYGHDIGVEGDPRARRLDRVLAPRAC